MHYPIDLSHSATNETGNESVNNVQINNSTVLRQSKMGSSIRKSLLESSILKTSTIRHSKLENEIFDPDEDDTKLDSTLRFSIHIEEKQQASDMKNSFVSTECPITSVDQVEKPSNLYSPIYRIKTLPPYESCRRESIPLLPSQEDPNKITLVLDLDETLVHCSTKPLKNCHYIFPLFHDGAEMSIYVRIRPYARQLLEYCSLFCEIVVFTASIPAYGNTVINILDPERKYVTHRLFREHCTFINGSYIKDLNNLGRNLQRTVIVDNSIVSFAYHLNNGIPIVSWFDDWEDRELYELAKLLYSLFSVRDIPQVLESIYNMEDIINAFELSCSV